MQEKPATVTVTPKAIEIEEGDELPEIELRFDGLQFEEVESTFAPIAYAVYVYGGTEWNPNLGPLAVGEYDVRPLHYAWRYANGNYMVTLANGKLRVKPSVANKRVTFTVVDANGGAALAEASVAIADATLKTDAAGKVSIVLPLKGYSYDVAKAEYDAYEGKLAVLDADQELTVTLKKLEVTVAYKTDGNGVIAMGAAVQRLPMGGDGEQVVAVPNAGYQFVSWEDGAVNSMRRDEDARAEATPTARFGSIVPREYILSYGVTEGGEFVNAPGEMRQAQELLMGATGAEVEVRVKPGYFFAGWSDGVTTLKRKDEMKGDMSVRAQFYKAFPLPYVENFEGVSSLPFAWRVENYESYKNVVLWEVGQHGEYTMGTGRCAYIDCGSLGSVVYTKADAGLLTPWIDVSQLGGSDVEVSFSLVHKKIPGSTKSGVSLEFRTDENGMNWTKVFETKDAVETAALRNVRVLNASFGGKVHVQFRWVYKADWEKGAAIDNITVGLASKAVMVYTARDNGRVTTDPNNPSASTKECTIETVPGTLGSEVTAVSGEGYEFDKWDDMRGEVSRRDDRNGRFRALF